MNIHRCFMCLATVLLGLTFSLQARADNYSFTGNFTSDNNFFVYSFSTAVAQPVTFTTTSYASGGFIPVLTLFNAAGRPVDNAGTGVSDVSLMDTLVAGFYTLYLTEFPNVANGNLADGFLFAGSPTATGDNCYVSGGKFLDSITCTQRLSNYTLNVQSSSPLVQNSPVPEPATWMLVLPGMLALGFTAKRLSA